VKERTTLINFFYRLGIVVAVLTAVAVIVVAIDMLRAKPVPALERLECARALEANRADGSCRNLSTDEMKAARELAVCLRARNETKQSGQDPDSACTVALGVKSKDRQVEVPLE
jgi:hypothetical protein